MNEPGGKPYDHNRPAPLISAPGVDGEPLDAAETLGGQRQQAGGPSGVRAAGERAIVNTLYRSSGEIVGRLASLALFADTARKLGQGGLGTFVFAVAYLGFVMVAVDLGLDRYLLRAIVRDRDGAEHMFFDVFALKLSLALPLFCIGLVGVHVLGYGGKAELTTLALAPGVLADSLARTQSSYFMAHERGAPPSIADACQRILSAGLGIAALQVGFGVVAVAESYSIGSIVGVLIGFVLLHRTLGMPRWLTSARHWRAMAAESIPYGVQDTFSVMLARMDTLILSLIGSEAAVGRYGAAYRLFESSFLITYALAGSFSAMFTYLRPDSEPPLRFVFQQSIKLGVVVLMSLFVAFAVLGERICRLIYGAKFGSAGLPLQILSPAVILMSIVTMCVALLVSQRDARQVVRPAAVMAGVNILLNLILIPLFNDTGAAAAMLATELLYAGWMMRRIRLILGRVPWTRTVAGALCAGAAMAVVMVLLRRDLLASLACGALAYAVVLAAVERVLSPLDFSFVLGMARRRLLPR